MNTLINYFQEKLNEHGLNHDQTKTSIPSSELTSPLYTPLTSFEEQTILSSYMVDQDYETNSLIKTTTDEPAIAVAMKLPRNFIPLNIKSTTTNEIIHSPYHQDTSFEYKKELPSDILDKYAGVGKKKQQQQQIVIHGKKNKKNKKVIEFKYVLYIDYIFLI